MASTTNNVPGMNPPTQVGMIGSNPKDSAIQYVNNMNQKQNAINGLAGGYMKRKQTKQMRSRMRRSRMRRSGVRRGGAIPVYQYNVPYPVQNGPGQDPNSQIVANTTSGTQNAANAVYDSQATNMSGGRQTKKKTFRKRSKKSGKRKTHYKRKK
jgi:hypothetical protein